MALEWIEIELEVVVDFTPPGETAPEPNPVIVPGFGSVVQVGDEQLEITVDAATIVAEDDVLIVPSDVGIIRRTL